MIEARMLNMKLSYNLHKLQHCYTQDCHKTRGYNSKVSLLRPLFIKTTRYQDLSLLRPLFIKTSRY